MVTLERDGLTMVVKQVPARICENCGEQYVDEEIALGLFKTAEEMAKSGAQVDVLRFRIEEISADLLFFKNRFWERLIVNIGIVLVFAAFYLRFIRKP